MLYLVKMKLSLIILGIGVLVFDAVLFMHPDKTTSANFAFNLAYSLIYFLGAIVAFSRVHKFPSSGNTGKSMIYYGIGMVMYGAGLIVWTYYNLVAKIDIPYPSLADVFFLLFYPGVILGTYYLLKSLGGKITLKLFVEGFIILIVFFITLYLFLNQTSLGPGVTGWAKILNILYPFADAFITALAITALRTDIGISEHPYILYFVFAFIVAASADTIFSFRSAIGVYWNGDISDLLFAISGFLISWGILSIKNLTLTDHTPR